MRKFSLILTLLIAPPAFAGLELGHYEGVTQDGQACTFQVSKVYFAGVKHPLNERVELTSGETQFTLVHMPVLDIENKSVLFDREHLTGTLGVPGGAVAAVMTMIHSDEFHGPSDFTLVQHNYKSPDKSAKTVCSQLKRFAPAQ